MTVLFCDFETFSRADLRKTGAYRYACDPSTEPLMMAYAFDDGAVKQWVPAEGQRIPRELSEALDDPGVTKSAWNASFEKAILKYTMGRTVKQKEWRCSMVRAMTLSLPGKLGDAGPILDLSHDKLKDARGKLLIRKFCGPRKPTKTKPYAQCTHHTDPDDWEEFKEYNRQDIVAERAITKRTMRWDLPAHEWEMWWLDQEINDDGMPVNMDAVRSAISYVEHVKAERFEELKELTGVANPRAPAQLLPWLKKRGYRFDDMKKGHVQQAAVDESLSERVRRVCELRLEVSRTSTDKYYAIERAASEVTLEGRNYPGHVVRGGFQFAAAQRTWRWGGRIFQPQNLPRPNPEFEKIQAQTVRNLETFDHRELDLCYEKPMDLLASCVRNTVQAPEGEIIFSADLNAIENRVLGWMAGDEKILDVFRADRCPYVDFATYMYDEPYDKLEAEWKGGDKSKRTIAKPAVLGCGYMLSAGEQHENKRTGEIEATGLLGYGWNMGVKLTPEQAKESVAVWRSTFTDVVDYWWEIEKAAKRCVRTGKATEARWIRFERDGPLMKMVLPSGRSLHYIRPRLEEVTTFWCREKRKYLPLHLCKRADKSKTRTKESLSYEGLNDKNKWVRIYTHPGKITENADQAISRDLIAEAMQRFRRRVPRKEARIRLHVHDEIGGTCKEKDGDRMLKILEECMSEEMSWAPGLPLKAPGSLSKVWIKD